MKKLHELCENQVFLFAGDDIAYKVISMSRLYVQYERASGKGRLIERGSTSKFYDMDVVVLDNEKNREAYQFAAGADGWRNARPFIVRGITHEQATILAYGMATGVKCEVRYAQCTNYQDVLERNRDGELFGNGYYVDPGNIYRYMDELNK